MNNPRHIVYKSNTSDSHYIFLNPLMYLMSFEKDSYDIKCSSPNCSFCNKLTEQFGFYSVLYSMDDQRDKDGYLIDAICLGYVCADHIDEPDFQTKIILFVSQRLEEIAKNLASMTSEYFTITSSN